MTTALGSMFASQEELTEPPRGRVSDDLHLRSAVARGRTLLDRDGHQYLAAGGPASTCARLDPDEEAFIGVNVAVQPLTAERGAPSRSGRGAAWAQAV